MFKVNVEKTKPAGIRKKNYIDDAFVDPLISMNAVNSYVNEGPAYNAIDWVKRLIGWFKGSNEEAGEYLGKAVIDGEEIHLADSDYIGKILGHKRGKVNLGTYSPITDEIFYNPDSLRYGYHPVEVVRHEKVHKYKPHASEAEADSAGRDALKRSGVFN